MGLDTLKRIGTWLLVAFAICLLGFVFVILWMYPALILLLLVIGAISGFSEKLGETHHCCNCPHKNI